jgi:hypothetical protein
MTTEVVTTTKIAMKTMIAMMIAIAMIAESTRLRGRDQREDRKPDDVAADGSGAKVVGNPTVQFVIRFVAP